MCGYVSGLSSVPLIFVYLDTNITLSWLLYLYNKFYFNIRKTKIMASGPITSWEIDGETVETVPDFIFLDPKITVVVIAAMKLKDTYSLEGKLWPT